MNGVVTYGLGGTARQFFLLGFGDSASAGDDGGLSNGGLVTFGLGGTSGQLVLLGLGAGGATAPGDMVTTENAYFRRSATLWNGEFARGVTGSDATFRRTVTTADAER